MQIYLSSLKPVMHIPVQGHSVRSIVHKTIVNMCDLMPDSNVYKSNVTGL
jgi:hypothetical protein